uniref:CD109 antigen n=1 Tax=Tauphaedusa tau TaxID=2306593 RepID=Q3V653_9EUPU|nr:thioester-containing protein [Tauphaedusa tau]
MRALLVLAVAIAAAWADNSYVVISPSKIRANMDLSLSVNILKATADVTVTASILRGTTSVATGTGVFKAGTPDSLTLKIPQGLPNAGYTLSVVGTGGLIFNNSTPLTFNSKELSLFIQSDKAIYKPGDTVDFRAFAVYADLKSYTGPIDISVFDAAANKIKQWLQVKPTDGVITQNLTLSSQPVLGDWRIHVETGDSNVEKVFTVAEYVLPKFEVDVVMPSYSLTTDTDITFTVKAKYTYGKPVTGTADVSVKLNYDSTLYDYSRALPVSAVHVPVDGEAKVTIPMADVKRIRTSLNGNVLIVTANVSESLTGNTMSGNGTVKLYDKGVTLEFPKTNPNTFKPGLKYTAYLKVSQPDGLPVSTSTQTVNVNTDVVIELPGITPTPYFYYQDPTESRKLPVALYDVPDNGLVEVPVDIPNDAKSATITATFQGVSATLSLGKSHSPSNSYIQLFLETTSAIQAGDSIPFRVKATQPITSLVYQVLSRGGIVRTGSFNTNGQSEYTFSVKSDSSMAPNARIVVYYVRTDGEIVTDSISFDVGGAFRNKVSISVNTTDAEPGDKVTVTVQADPPSTAHLLAIDQSVLLLKSGNDVSADDVYNELKAYDTIDSNSNVFPIFDDCPVCRRKRLLIWWPRPIFFGGNDATQIFQNSGVKVITDALVYHYQEPYPDYIFDKGGLIFEMAPGMPVPTAASGHGTETSNGDLQEPARTRSNFAETWLWLETSIGTNGTASISTQVPDTITPWVAGAFAVNSVTGLGVVPTQTHLRVFRPFFVSLNLPYSVTRGEQLALQAIVFNYMSDDMQVRVTLAKSSSFFNIIINANSQQELKQEDAVQDILVAAGDAKSVYFPIVPSDLGRIDVEVKAQSTRAADAVRRQLLVEAEGVPKEYNVPMLIDLTNGKNTFTETASLTLPATTVKGSELARVTAVGDMMGPTISGLDSLLQMPTGCGEQTMLGLAPDVYVTDYLKSVNQLTGDIKSKALGYMESGYQRELTYKHKDGSFSAFGDSDKSGSMWLTAFVTRVFHQAKAHIYIDDSIIITALQWMIGHQNSDGSFPEPGNVIHKNMQGNAANGTALTIFVLISLLENHDLLVNTNAAGYLLDQAAAKALAYSEKAVANTDDLYILAMAAYAFQLAGSTQTQAVLTKLEQKASVKDGSKYWHQVEAPKTTNLGWESPNPTQAVGTEITSYVLLTYAAQGDLVKAKNVIQWITKQRNPHGGFQSTQDTVVALFAMSQFAKQVYSNNFNVHVTATLSPTLTYNFNIDQTNALLLQSRETNTVPAQVKVDASGSGMALVEVAVFFNVESEIEETKFELKVTLLEETINHLVVETCTRWLGEGPSSGMAVQEIGIPSGFEVDLESMTQLPTLKRTETQNKKVILYFDQISTTPVCLNFKAERTGLVAKSQPVAVRVYDYYAPHNQVTAFYQSQILKDSSICDVCKDCEQCV